jgi:flagellar motor switch protein FliM
MSQAPLAPADSALILDEIADAAPGITFAPQPEPFALGQNNVRGAERLGGLAQLGDRLARALKPALEPITRGRVGVSALAPEQLSYGAWSAAQPAFTSLSLYRMRPLKGGMLIAIEPDFVARLVESFYGGSPASARQPRSREFTPSEVRLLNRLLDTVAGTVIPHWNEVMPLEASLVAQECNVAQLAFVHADEPTVVQRFVVASEAGPAEIQIVCPLATVRPLEERLSARGGTEEESGGGEWRRRLGEALQEVKLPVRSVLARPEISVAGLLALKPGDVIPITLPPRTPLLAGARRIAEGVIGEQDGRAALRVERVGQA